MSIDLWLSILLAIPLSIAGNLLTPAFSRWTDKYIESTRHRKKQKSRRRRLAQVTILRTELERIQKFTNNRHLLTEYLLIVLIQIAGIGALASVYTGVLSLAGELNGRSDFLGIIVRSCGQLFTLFASIFITRIAFKAVTTRKNVRDFEEYEKSTLATISKLEEP